jgi:hypothetical protein
MGTKSGAFEQHSRLLRMFIFQEHFGGLVLFGLVCVYELEARTSPVLPDARDGWTDEPAFILWQFFKSIFKKSQCLIREQVQWFHG